MNKPNKKYVTIKGWGMKRNGGWAFIEAGYGVYAIPAELRIKIKYIKKEKKDE